MLTIERVKELAKQNYCKGGDTIVECYEDYQIQELIDGGVDTEEKLLKMFQEQYEIDEEYRQAAKWYAYGTTDDEEIAEFLGGTTSTEYKRKCKDCAQFFKDPHDLCYLAEIDEVDGNTDACEKFEQYYGCDDDYTPSATNGDYSPSNPWDAPGMSIKDFI